MTIGNALNLDFEKPISFREGNSRFAKSVYRVLQVARSRHPRAGIEIGIHIDKPRFRANMTMTHLPAAHFFTFNFFIQYDIWAP